MKRVITIVLIAVALLTTWHLGRRDGIQHAVLSSEIYIEEDAILIDLDGQVYEHLR